MTDSSVFKLNKPEQNDPLQEVLREGARKRLAAQPLKRKYPFLPSSMEV